MVSMEYDGIANYLLLKLDQEENNFSEDDLKNVDQLIIDYNIDAIENLELLNLFPNLRKLTIKNLLVTVSDLRVIYNLDKLKSICLDSCKFEDASAICLLKLETLDIINCNIKDYNFIYAMTWLKSLTVIGGQVDFYLVNRLKNLIYLDVSHSVVVDSKQLKLDQIKKIYLNNSNVKDISSVLNCNNVNAIGLDSNQIDKNEKIISTIRLRKIKVLLDGIIELNENGEPL